MTLKSFVAQERWVQTLQGYVCVDAQSGHAGVLLLNFGYLHPPDKHTIQQPGRNLVVEYPWRLETADQVLVGDFDDEELRDLHLQACVGKRVTAITVHRPSFMVHIAFEDDFALWVFPNYSRDYAAQSEDPQVGWYVTGSDIPDEWEE